jgi:hypothetical protein
MHLEVDRYLGNPNATLSRISIDKKFECYGLEDEYRPLKQKVFGETRIPAGTYKVIVRTFGGFHSRYSEDSRFKDFHQGMLEIKGVPGFTDILIHVGNFDRNTNGCLLVGTSANAQNMSIGSSAIAYERLYKKVIAAAQAGDLTISFYDNDR